KASALNPTSKDFMSRSYAVIARPTASLAQTAARRSSFHDVQQRHLLPGRHLGDVVFVVATRIERLIEGICPFPQRIAVRGIPYLRDRAGCPQTARSGSACERSCGCRRRPCDAG